MTTQRTFQTEFGNDFNLGINLDGWTDNSWKNDVCPCFTIKAGKDGTVTARTMRLWVDFENERSREDWDNRRYTLELKFDNCDTWFTQWMFEDSQSAQELLNNHN